ncbi:MAG: 2-oxoglutarate dehydrogenase E1 component [Candidatus Bipolaricaulia bacterium]
MTDSLERIARSSPTYVEELYQQFRQDPTSVPEEWALVFKGYEFGLEASAPASGTDKDGNPPGVLDLVHSYREFGHLIAEIDPLGRRSREHPLLRLEEFGLSEDDLDREVSSPFYGLEVAALGEVYDALQRTYCRSLGVEFMHIGDTERREWLLERMEPTYNRPHRSAEQRKWLLRQLVEANGLERFLHAHYRGAKRFSSEGGEALIPLLNSLLERAGSQGVQETVMGMPHRGRLTVLAHVLHKPKELILAEFEGLQENEDVKYHMGYSRDYTTESGQQMHLTLAHNPSHLEAVDPVVLGQVRAKQRIRGDQAQAKVIPVLMHGDAAFSAQGIVYETQQLSALDGFKTGGTVHLLINNQLGFTTRPKDARSTRYASDIAKIVGAPVFHVNADDPEAVIWAAELALDYRQTFGTDVVIDFVCYRQYGHNELDDPAFTQPAMYNLISNHPSVTDIYAEQLQGEGIIGEGDLQRMRDEVRADLDEALECARDEACVETKEVPFRRFWEGFGPAGNDWGARTRLDADTLKSIADQLPEFPVDFTPHRRIPKMFNQIRDLVHEGEDLHWAIGETLAYGSLLLENYPIRLCGQDSERGTFSHRHAVLYDAENANRYVPLNDLDEAQAQFEVVNSPLSELGVLGFEYGMASSDPYRLVIWEAQYGDFANGAQVVIDQFVTSGEAKWSRQNGLVMLLPHGYEGQGPEHSSARLERFLQLAGENNIQVAYPTTPAQFFHLLRRQMHRDFRKPLIVMTPKSMLRHKRAVSSLSEFTAQDFQTVLRDDVPSDPQRVVMCSGKVYYTLLEAREERGLDDQVALVRVEQLYPFPERELREALGQYSEEAELVWVQEEPQNQGAWRYMQTRLPLVIGDDRPVRYIGRPEAASPATGNFKTHKREEELLIDEALAELTSEQADAASAKAGQSP